MLKRGEISADLFSQTTSTLFSFPNSTTAPGDLPLNMLYA